MATGAAIGPALACDFSNEQSWALVESPCPWCGGKSPSPRQGLGSVWAPATPCGCESKAGIACGHRFAKEGMSVVIVRIPGESIGHSAVSRSLFPAEIDH